MLLLLASSFLSQAQARPEANAYKAKWVLVRGSSLKVAGSTNVNKFTCDIINYSTPDTILVHDYQPSKLFFPLRGTLHLDVTKFDCHNPMMTSDLCKTLRAKEFPKLRIQFLSFNNFPVSIAGKETVKGQVNISLAGASRVFMVNYVLYKEGTVVHLIGKQQVRFSDFNLVPPRKLGGMIKTKEELEVEFHLTMKAI
ncbi:MAG: YceI family protein [Chitinophagaceae bacterium]|nr:MAG: YceI family protein [Chitinophagaceae bacterium]